MTVPPFVSPPITSETYQDLHWETADEFVTALLGLGEIDAQLFRGVASADYELIPTALRTNPLPFVRMFETNVEQIRAELRVLRRFHRAAYAQGLTIPGPGVREFFDRARFNEDKVYNGSWPPSELHEFMAIAQHHGVPTRLLDWTTDPMVAAYFAARACGEERAPDGDLISERIAVWAYNPAFKDPELLLPHARMPLPQPIHVPYDLNRNAHAQRGVFTLHSVDQGPASGGPAERQPLDQYLWRLHMRSCAPFVKRVTLPARQAGRLMRLLHARRIDGSTMFPGYDGARRAAFERAIWDQ